MSARIESVENTHAHTLRGARNKVQDVTGGDRRAMAAAKEKFEPAEGRAVRKGHNDTAVLLSISPAAKKRFQASMNNGESAATNGSQAAGGKTHAQHVEGDSDKTGKSKS